MRLLLDTHALLWWFLNDPLLSRRAENAIETASEVFISASSAWEIATKVRIGKLPDAVVLANGFVEEIAAESFHPLAVSVRHGQLAGLMEGAHKDPFDRMLIAQALVEDLVLVSNEAAFDAFGVKRLW